MTGKAHKNNILSFSPLFPISLLVKKTLKEIPFFLDEDEE